MIAILIPFFLVARIAIDDDSWKFGPEYVFEVGVNMSASPKAQNNGEMGTFLKTNLLCRPKLMDSLICYLSNGVGQNFDDMSSEENSEEMKPFNVSIADEPFELVFNNRGVEKLIVNSNTHSDKLNMLRRIVDQFSIGTDLNSKPDGTFRATQNSTIGECAINFKVRHYPSKGLMRKTRNNLYNLESLAQLNKIPGETVNIEKSKDLKNCTRYGKSTVFDKKIQRQLVSSVSRIEVSDTTFTSTTINIGTIGSPKLKKVFYAEEIISVTLTDIQAAQAPLPEISNAGEMSVITNSYLDSYVI